MSRPRPSAFRMSPSVRGPTARPRSRIPTLILATASRFMVAVPCGVKGSSIASIAMSEAMSDVPGRCDGGCAGLPAAGRLLTTRWMSSAGSRPTTTARSTSSSTRRRGLQAIVAIHDSRLGPALGGCRFIEYDTDEDALVDALRLARGMTYKAALAGLAHGGGKSVHHPAEAATSIASRCSARSAASSRISRPLHHRRGQRHRPRGHGDHPHA